MFRVRVATSGWSGGPGLNTFYFVSLVENAAEAQLCVTRVQSAFTDGKALYPSIVRIQVSGDVDLVDSINGDVTDTITVDEPPVINGGGPDASYMAPATAALLQLRSSKFSAGSRLRGRAFISPLYSQNVNGDGTNTTAAKALVLAMGAALLDIGVAGPKLVVWRRPKTHKDAAGNKIVDRVGMTGDIVAVSTPAKFAVLKSRRD